MATYVEESSPHRYPHNTTMNGSEPQIIASDQISGSSVNSYEQPQIETTKMNPLKQPVQIVPPENYPANSQMQYQPYQQYQPYAETTYQSPIIPYVQQPVINYPNSNPAAPNQPYNYSPLPPSSSAYSATPVSNDPSLRVHDQSNPYPAGTENKGSVFSRLSELTSMKTERNDRRSFIKKVYGLVCCQLIFTAVITAIVVGVKPLREGVKETIPAVIVCMVLTLILMLAIVCRKSFAKKYPYNYYALGLFTFLESYVVAFVCSYYDPLMVLAAAVSTLVITAALTLYAWKTKRDFTTCGGMLVITVMSLIMFGFFMIFLYNRVVYLVFCFVAVILYGFFIVYDAQLIAGGRYQELSYDDYVIGALLLYIDIVGLFIYILSILGSKK